MRAPQVVERIFWTFVAAALANLGLAGLLDVEVWKASVMAGTAAVLNLISIFARYRLSVLPDPGDGLPGYEVTARNGRG